MYNIGSVFVSWNGERGNYHNTIARIPIIVHGVFEAEKIICVGTCCSQPLCGIDYDYI